jgi:hypothetical protein
MDRCAASLVGKLFSLRVSLVRALLAACGLAIASSASATLVFYYDPATGNVSFDTAATRSGELFSYSIGINKAATPIRFRTENLVRAYLRTV